MLNRKSNSRLCYENQNLKNYKNKKFIFNYKNNCS